MRPWLSAVVLSLVVAGCADDADLVTAPADGGAETEGDLTASAPGPAPSGGLFLLDAMAGPDHPLTGFVWTIPEGAIQHSAELDQDMLALDLVLLGDANPPPMGETSFLVFWLGPDGAEPLQTNVQWPGSYSYKGSGMTQENNYTQFSPGYHGALLGADDLQAGDRLGLVLGARGPAMALHYGMHVNPGTPFDDGYERIRSEEDLVAATRVPVAAAGTGAGVCGGLFFHVDWPWADTLSTLSMGNVEVSSSAGTLDETRYKVDCAVAQGWSVGQGYHSVDDARGIWTLSGSAHGLPLQDVSPLVVTEDPTVGILTSLVSGFPLYTFYADGAGDAAQEFVVTADGDPTETFRLFSHITLGATVPELLGVEAKVGYFGWGTGSRFLTTVQPPA